MKKEFKPYRLKHIPSGLYYQPSSTGNNLSEKGKIYNTNLHGLSEKFNKLKRYPEDDKFRCSIKINSRIFKKYSDIFNWHSENSNNAVFVTKLTDWEIEYL